MSLTNLVAGSQDTATLQTARGPLSEQSLAELSATLSDLTDELKYRADHLAIQTSDDGVPFVHHRDAVLYSDFEPAMEVYKEIKRRLDGLEDSQITEELSGVTTPSLDVSLIQLGTRLRTTAGIPATLGQAPSKYVLVVPDEDAINADAVRSQKSAEVRNYASRIGYLLNVDERTGVAEEASNLLANGNIPIRYFSLKSERLYERF